MTIRKIIATAVGAALFGAAAIVGSVVVAGSLASAPAVAEQMAGDAVTGNTVAAKTVEVWKAASCGCCGGWVTHMRESGFQVTVHEVDDVDPVKAQQGVPPALQSCHTAVVDGYVLEGHVPASDVKRLLTERPKARGLAVPGMPQDAPGMDMKTGTPYQTVLFGGPDGKATVYARH